MTPPEHTTGLAARLARALKTGTFDPVMDPLSEFACIRHFVRANHTKIADARLVLARVRRAPARLAASPFNKHRIKQANDHIAALGDYLQELYRAQEQFGRIVIELASRIDASTTVEQRLDILNCNTADRAELNGADLSLVNLIAVHCVEDSAAHRGDKFNDRPLHNAINAEIMRVMCETTEGRAASTKLMEEALAPGGMFYGVRTGRLQPDGTMKLQAPALVLHDAHGSRVIERLPS